MNRKPTVAPAVPAKTGLDVAIVAELAKVVGKYDLSEVEIEHDGLKIRVARERHPMSISHVVAAPGPLAPPPTAAIAAAPAAEASPDDHPGAVKSPMVGTAYLSPNPESKPFVEIGSLVKAGDKLLLVEAMKTFNEILSPRGGKIIDILVENGSPVEYDQTLMIIE